ncbi:MAG: hypothetical protein A3F10_04080 [Coxiella sp. RIFCSPHIGHO2_12_FULL_42_15]|nr:MAG: hypothetical protein A3F10_04080 [Coxiella sp. RIFCSPHIGHO2_12_FULL_42_15]
MNTFLAFLAQHWLLSTLFIIAFCWLIFEESRHQGLGGARQSPQGVTHLINREDAVIVDLRDANAFRDGAIAKSINIPYPQLNQNLVQLEKFKDRPIILVDAMGQQSAQVMHKLKKHGFAKLFLLGGGLSAWKKAGLPLKKN